MGMHRFSLGTRFRWNGKTYEIRQFPSENTVTLQEVLTREETVAEMPTLVKALFDGELFFIIKSQSSKSSKSSSNLDTQQLTLDDYPEYLVNVALYRLQVILPILGLESKDRTQKVIESRVAEVRAAQDPAFAGTLLGSVSRNSIYNWIQAYVNGSNDIRALIPFTKRCGGKNKHRIDSSVDNLITTTIQELYKVRETVSIDDVVQEVECKVAEVNTSNVDSKQFVPPSRSTVARRIEELGLAERFALRHGKRAAKQKFSQYGQNDYSDIPLERTEIDHTRADFIVIDDADNLPLGRPTVTYCLDMATRYPLGQYIGFEPPSYMTVMECLYHAICPKESVREKYGTDHDWIAYGIPSTLVIDNGREFIGRDLSDACLSLGIILQQTPVRTPHFKAGIERHFGTLNTMLFHTLPGTTFSNPQERGDYNSLEQACVYLSDVDKILHTFVVDVYAENFHRGLEGIPARHWEEAIKSGFLPSLPTNVSQLQILLGRVTERVIWPYGIEFESLRYNSNELVSLRTNLKGKKVKIKYHPGDLSHLYVFDPFDERYIKVPALDQEYTQGLSLWKHKIIRNAALNEQDKVDAVALGRAKRRIREIVAAGRDRKHTGTRTKLARWETSGKPFHQLKKEQGAEPLAEAPAMSKEASPEDSGSQAVTEEELLVTNSDEGWGIDYSLSKKQNEDLAR